MERSFNACHFISSPSLLLLLLLLLPLLLLLLLLPLYFPGGDASLADLERARDDLDAAQEEVVVWTEKCDALKESLRVAHDKIEVYEQLVVAANKNAQMRIEQIQAQASAALAGSGGLGELLMTVKQTLDKGTKMWKNNQRNEVFDLYLHVCEDAMQALKTPGLLNHLTECTSQGRMQGQAKKERGAIVLKKGLDRLVVDLANPEYKRAEDEAAQAILNEVGVTTSGTSISIIYF